MGHLDRRGGIISFLKMDITWLSLVLGVVTLATPALSSEPRVVCYYTNWSVYRPGTARFNPQNINPYLCTHLVYAFGGFTKDNTLKPFDKYQDIEKGGYAKFTGLKTYNKNLKTLLAIGGWNEGSSRFSPMVASRERRKEFVRNAIKFLRQNRFDGLDLDWEYPAFRDGGKAKDRENYAKLVKELREEFERESEKTRKPRLLLTMAVPAGIEYIQKGFDVKTLNQYLDWMNLLTYDYHSAFEPAVNHHAPLYPLEEPNEYSVDTELNIDYTIKFYLENGADPDKLVLGIPTYGRSYTLFNADAVEIGSPADGPGEQGDATREKGYLAYYEICESLKPKTKKRSASEEYSEEYEEEDEEWTVMRPNPAAMGPVAFKGNQWVGYDDMDIVRKKGEYVAENGLGGIMFWSIDNDDFRGNCHEKPYPLIEAAKEAYIAKLGTTDNNAIARTSKPVSKPSSGSRRRNRPKSTTTTPKPSTSAKSNKRKSSVSSTTPSWNITPEPPTTPDPGSDFKCVDEGFYPHPRDCKKYFWCLDSGPSDLGIVAHQFTCPSGLFFNKAADSCDFARNVLCKVPASTTKAPATRSTTTVTTTTTKKPVRLSTKSSVQFRTTTTTTTPEPESEEYEDEVSEDITDEDAEDPRVIKELIDLIKKVGGVEQLEKQLHLAESSASTDGASTTTPTPFNKRLYQKVLERARGKNKFPSNSILQTAPNSRAGPQNQGLEATADKDTLLKKDRPQYTTINRQRTVASTPEPEDSEEDEDQPEEPVQQSRARAAETQARESQTRSGTTSKPLQYVNIRRARPATTSDTADDTASRNALFERSGTDVSAPEPNSLDIQSSKKENVPEYVTIRRQRPTTEETTTIQYQEPEVEPETALEREISSQPQYTSIVRARGTTVSVSEEPSSSDSPFIRPRSTTPTPPEEFSSPEPTTVLAVQISSLLNSPSSVEEAETTVVQTTEAEPTTTSTTSRLTTTTTTTTAAPAPSSTPRRTLLRRRGSTTTTTSTQAPPTSTTQVSARNYTFVRRRRPIPNRNEILDSDDDLEVSRKVRSTTPDSREVDQVSLDGETGQAKRFRSRTFQTTQAEDSVAAAAVSRGQFRPSLSSDEIVSLTPLEEEPQFVPRQKFSSRTERQFRGRTTVADTVVDSVASAATDETRRPIILPRGRNRFTVSSSTAAAVAPSTESTSSQRRPTFARFSPRPFGRTTAPASSSLDVEDNNKRTATRLSFGRSRLAFSTTAAPAIQARKLPFPSRGLTTPQSLVSEIDDDDEPENKVDDISLSESAIEEKEHLEEEVESDFEEASKQRVLVEKLNAPGTIEESPTEAIPIDDSGKRRFKIIRRRPATTTTTTEAIISTEIPVSQAPRIRKVIRKKINRIVEEEPEIIAKSIGSLETLKITTTTTPTTEAIINYGEKRRPFSTNKPTPSTTTTEQVTEMLDEEVTESIKEEILRDILVQQNDDEKNNNEKTESIKTEEVEVKQDEIVVKDIGNEETKEDTEENKEKEVSITSVNTETDLKPEVAIETEQKAIDLSETKETTVEEPNTTEVIEPSPETTTTSTTVLPSPTPRARLPFRSQKRLFTSTTESVPSSSRTFSRKYNPGVYTSPASVPTRAAIAFRPSIANRRPPLFTRRPFTTARTTTRLVVEEEEEEPEYSDEEFLDEEPENPFVFVPSSQLFTRKPDDDEYDTEGRDEESEEIFEDGNENDQDEEEPQQRVTSTTKRPFRPRLINSNTFRTSTSTTELPRRFGTSQNRTNIYNRFSSNKPVNDTKKRVANVPVGYNSPVAALTPTVTALKNGTQLRQNIPTTTSASVTETETTTDDDYLEMTQSTSTLSDSTNTETLSTNTVEAETATAQMEISTDDYLEFTELTTNYPSTQDDTTNAHTVYLQNTASNTETTTEISPQTTTNTPIPPIIKTQFDKLFSVSRVVEVSSKLDKHRLNKNNETTLIEEGQVMVEKKPVVDKIGEVSRFSFIKIVEDDIPIYLTKLRHVYPVDNPPDNLIRIDEARNARALNYLEPPRENLVASESVNEAYRHIKKLSDLATDDTSKSEVEHVTGDDFLSYINVEKSDKTQEKPLYSQWQFFPAAYENEKNKASKSFEIVTPRSILPNPSTLSLEGLFKTEMPLTARKVSDDHSQPFVVYSASIPTQKEEANIVKLDVLKPEGRSILTFAKGQEFNSSSTVDESTVKSPISVSIVPNTESTTPVTTTKTTSTTENINTSPLVEMLTNRQSTVTEPTTMLTTEEAAPTTETVSEETTTVKLSPVELKRAKYGGFPRRPIIKTANLTRINVPRTAKKNNSTVSANLFQKSNKTATFSPNKSRFSVNRSQNVPVDIRKKGTSKTPKVYTTDAPRTTTERKPYFKPSRPTFRPAFIPRRTTLPPTTQDS